MASVAGLGGGSNLDGICRFVMPQLATLGRRYRAWSASKAGTRLMDRRMMFIYERYNAPD